MKKQFLIDTNICIFFMRGKYHLDQKFCSVGGRNCYVSSIGATAIANDMIVVTENVKHIGKIPGIEVENWIRR